MTNNRIRIALWTALVFFAWALPIFAQNARLELKNLEKLSSKASEVKDVTLDGAMLQLASKFMNAADDPDAAEVQSLIKDLKGIYVKNFEFDKPNQYSQADVQAIRAQLTGPGWQRIVEARNEHAKEHDEIYVMKQGNAIMGLAILVAEPTELTVVNLVGPIDINKLAELQGHFGIPGDEDSGKKKQKEPTEKPQQKEGAHEQDEE
ncbi:MAG TPA: DUF4252 domain-containing protein [Terriglobales bacterium]|nr:DUF4252 domain-containing protein [Terriglobales bacterium]